MTLLPFSAPGRTPSDVHVDVPGHVAAPLRGGGTALLRPLRDGEDGPLLEVFAGMSDSARAARYLAGMSRLPAVMTAALTSVDGCRHAAWLATVAGRPAGIARYLRTGPGSAELAFEVVDDLHGRGLGSILVDAVTTVAAANGVRQVEATVVPGNQASIRLLGRLGIRLVVADGLLEGRGRLQLLDPALVDRDAVVALASRLPAGTAESAPPVSAGSRPAPARAPLP
jgi:GNAT superfamily N-acetyltransferase